MPIMKRIICLANSRKMQGRCIAGREIGGGRFGGWIRPVSDREHQEVSEDERQYPDGSDPRLLDVIDIPLVEHRPHTYQSENWLIDPLQYWTKVRQLDSGDLDELVDPIGSLWENGNSTYAGLNDRMCLQRAQIHTTSLKFLKTDDLQLSVLQPSLYFGSNKRRVQARFTYGGVQYWLSVTDPVFTRIYLSKADGDYTLGEAFLTVSLSEPFKGDCYKLVAAIILRKDAL